MSESVAASSSNGYLDRAAAFIARTHAIFEGGEGKVGEDPKPMDDPDGRMAEGHWATRRQAHQTRHVGPEE